MTKKTKATETVELKNSGVAVIYIGRSRVMPGESIEVGAEMLDTDGVQFLISRKELVISGNAELTAEIREKNLKRKKADPTEGKSQKEVEDGGEY